MATKTLHTIAEFERLPDEAGVRFELNQGELVRMAFPTPRHNLVVGKIFRLLCDFVDAHSLGTVFPSDTGFVLSRDPDTLRGPDVSFISEPRAAGIDMDRNIDGAPDLAVEVVSGSDSAEDLNKKVKQYFAAGCRTVGVVYPATRDVAVYEADGSGRNLSGQQELTAPDLVPGFAVPVSELFVA
ncbi:MAG: Uma2 family endonuclease [bacterium]|nr:Uma2 family endonuclease [bacterium]